MSRLFNDTIVHSVQEHTVFTFQYITKLIVVHTIESMETPSRTTPYLDILCTPPVYKTYIFLQDSSFRDNLMHSIKTCSLEAINQI